MPSASTTPAALASDGPSHVTTLGDDLTLSEREAEVPQLRRGEQVGRYVILEHVGSGGMGVVYAAYDRDLDRRVALKLLHARRRPAEGEGQARLLREAQAMARLAHPNVVAVHEASTYEGRLFIAMEFVDGQTLGRWLERSRRSWREVALVMLQAGRGLAAAHHQGLVHRDFKPDNVLVGRDGRARVVDFGLARSLSDSTRDEIPVEDALRSRDNVSLQLTQTGALAGTPAYMAPEQFRGRAPTERSDQFSFCVTLWEALYGERPFRGDTRAQLAMAICRGELRDPPSGGGDVPAFLRRLMRRGLSVRHEDRFPSMDALLDALAADPGRARRRVLVAGMAAATIATLSAAAARWSGPADAPCTAGQERLAEAWGDSQREAIEQAFARVDAEFAATSRQTVQQELDGYAAAWLEGYRDACEATHVRHEQSTELLDRRMACLEQRRSALRATAELLAQADRDAIAHSIRAATSLPPVGECARTDRLTAGFAAPPDPADAERAEHLRAQLAHAHALGTTGQAQAGLAEALGVQEQARALGYAPLRAEAALAVGILAYTGGRHEDSLPALHHAIDEAIAARHDEVLVSAATRLVSEIGVGLSRYDEAERWGRLALAAVERRGQDPDDAIDLHRTLCMMRADKGAPREALPDCERALELSIARFGPEHSTTGMAHRALGNAHYAAGDYAAAERDYQRATALFLASHGHDHPEYPALLNSLAAVCYSQRPGPACVDLFVQTLDVAVRSYGPEHPAVADFTNNLAIVLFEEGRIDEAETHARRSLELRRAAFGDGHPGVGAAHRVLAMVAQARHDDPSALDHANRAVSILRATRGAAHPDVLESLRVRADIHLDAQRIDEALLDLQEALRLVDQLERPASQRAEVRFSLARTLTDHRPGQAERARALAAEAEALAAGTPLAAQIAQWRAEPRDDAATSPPPSPSPGDRSPPPAPRPR